MPATTANGKPRVYRAADEVFRVGGYQQDRVEELVHRQVDCRIIQAYAEQLDACYGALIKNPNPELEKHIKWLCSRLVTKSRTMYAATFPHRRKMPEAPLAKAKHAAG